MCTFIVGSEYTDEYLQLINHWEIHIVCWSCDMCLIKAWCGGACCQSEVCYSNHCHFLSPPPQLNIYILKSRMFTYKITYILCSREKVENSGLKTLSTPLPRSETKFTPPIFPYLPTSIKYPLSKIGSFHVYILLCSKIAVSQIGFMEKLTSNRVFTEVWNVLQNYCATPPHLSILLLHTTRLFMILHIHVFNILFHAIMTYKDTIISMIQQVPWSLCDLFQWVSKCVRPPTSLSLEEVGKEARRDHAHCVDIDGFSLIWDTKTMASLPSSVGSESICGY